MRFVPRRKVSTGAGFRPFLRLAVGVRNVCPFLQGRGDSRDLAFYEIDGFSAASANRDDLLFGARLGIGKVWRKQQFGERDAESSFCDFGVFSPKCEPDT